MATARGGCRVKGVCPSYSSGRLIAARGQRSTLKRLRELNALAVAMASVPPRTKASEMFFGFGVAIVPLDRGSCHVRWRRANRWLDKFQNDARPRPWRIENEHRG